MWPARKFINTKKQVRNTKKWWSLNATLKMNSIRVGLSKIKLLFIRDADGLTEALGRAEGGWTEWPTNKSIQ